MKECKGLSTRLNGEYVVQGKVAEAAGVTEVTVRDRYKEMGEMLSLSHEFRMSPVAP